MQKFEYECIVTFTIWITECWDKEGLLEGNQNCVKVVMRRRVGGRCG
jgi:hypothetical protein